MPNRGAGGWHGASVAACVAMWATACARQSGPERDAALATDAAATTETVATVDAVTAAEIAPAAALAEIAETEVLADSAPADEPAASADAPADTADDLAADATAVADVAALDAELADAAAADSLAEVAPAGDAGSEVAADTGPPPKGIAVGGSSPSAWSGKFAAWPQALPAGFELPIGQPLSKPGIAPYPQLSSALIDDVTGDGVADLVLWAESGAVRVVHGPVGPNAAMDKFNAMPAGEQRIHSIAVLESADDTVRLLFGGEKVMPYWFAAGKWQDVGGNFGVSAKPEGPWRRGMTVADVDNDGLLDLLLAHYDCKLSGHEVWLDRGDGVLVEQGQPLGLTAKGSHWGAAAADWDGDGDTDLIWLHDGCNDPGTTQAFYRNLGRGLDGMPLFQRQAPHELFLFPKSKVPFASPMGLETADFDHDGQMDIAIANIGLPFSVETAMKFLLTEDPTVPHLVQNNLLAGQPDGTFLDVGKAAGLKDLVDPEKQLDLTAWGVRATDFDRDGWTDLLIANAPEQDAWANKTRGPMRPVLLRNKGDGTFAEVSALAGLPGPLEAPVLATGDLDGDGDNELVLGQLGAGPLVLRNDVQTPFGSVRVRLRGWLSNRPGRGARVELLAGGVTQTQVIGSDATYTTHHPPMAEFGMADVPAGQFTVHWPSGYVQVVPNLPTGKAIATIEEPKLATVAPRHAAVGQTIAVQAQAFGPNGQPSKASVAVETVPPGLLGVKAALACDPNGLCTASFEAKKAGTAFVKITLGGKLLQTWPKVTID